MVCIYCKAEKPAHLFNKDHVLPRCLGTFINAPTLTCVCKECNQAFGDDLELALGRDSYEALLRFQHKLKPLQEVVELRNRNLTATLNVDGPCRGARIAFGADERGVVIDLVDQAGIPFKRAGTMFLTLAELRLLQTSIKPHVVPGGKVSFIYKTVHSLRQVVEELERLGMTFTNLDSHNTFDIPHLEHSNVDIFYREGRRIHRALCKIALNYAAYQMGAPFVLSSDFDQIRAFVSSGSQPRFRSLFLSVDEPRNISDGPDTASEHHVVSLDWDGSPSQIAVTIELFGGRQYKLVLTDNYHGLFRTDLAHADFFDLKERTVREMARSRILLP